jgi:hypothetical protein
MRHLILVAAAATTLFGAAPVIAAEDAPPAAQTPPVPAPAPVKPGKPDKKSVSDPDRVVCTREHVVGSNRPQKVCMTVAERERARDAAVALMNNNRGADYNTTIGGPGR